MVKPESETLVEEESVSAVAKVAAKAASSQDATFEALVKKPRRVLKFSFNTTNDSGEPVKLRLKYQAISSRAYDDLTAAYPPTDKDKKAGETVEVAKFAPALISAVSVIPSLTMVQATEIYTAESWSGGETTSLYINALRVCNSGLDVPFNEPD